MLLAALVVALLACPTAALGATYAGMGDSYASGVGGSNEQGDCRRSNQAYPVAIDPLIPGSFSFPACSGARTNHMDQDVQEANGVIQVNFPGALDAGTQYVTMTLPINDGDIVNKLAACATTNCVGEMATLSQFWRDVEPGRMTRVFNSIRAKAPNARILVAGYPRFFNPTVGCANSFGFADDERVAINAMLDVLAEVTRDVTLDNGNTFVDARQPFIGHAVCDDEWINGVGGITSAYHPKSAGHAAYARLVAPALLAMRGPGETPGPAARFAFSSARDGNSEIYVANGDGSSPVNLTANAAADTQPAFAPDDSRIAFVSNRDGDNEIYSIKVDGTGLLKLTDNSADDVDPVWAPNGDYLTYSSNRDGDYEIFAARSDGDFPNQLTTNAVADRLPDWSPDGSEIAWVQSNDVWRMSSDGEGQLNLTANGSVIVDTQPSWEPGSDRIAIATDRHGPTNFEIYLIGRDGSTPTRLTNDSANDTDPTFAPAGGRIGFVSDRDSGDSEIYDMAADGTGQVPITTSPGSDVSPSRQGDRTDPDTTITSHPGTRTNDTTPTFAFSSSEPGVSFTCSLDGAAFAPCGSPFTTPALGEGPHTFAVRASDPTGHTDTTPAERAFTVDITPAVTTINSGPTGPTTDQNPSFSFSSTDPASTFECSLGGVTYEACTSPRSYTGLADGSYTFFVRGTDGAGNPDTAPASRSFTVDRTPPVVTIDSWPPAQTNSNSASFAFSADDPNATFACSLDGAAFESCTSPTTYDGLANGSHTFRVQASDPLGNISAPVERTWAIDAIAPETTIATGPSGLTSQKSPTFTYASPDAPVTFECSLDSAVFTSCPASGKQYTNPNLSDGPHVFAVRSVDASGNRDASPATRSFTVDGTPPETTLTGPPARTNASSVQFSFSSSEGPSTFQCSLDNEPLAACTSPVTRPVGEGSHNFRARAVDAAGNQDTTPAIVNFFVDRTPPDTVIDDSSPSGLINTQTPAFSFRLAQPESGATFECRIDSAAFAACTSPHTSAVLGQGLHTFEVRGLDDVGNADASPASRSFTVDTEAPTASITGGPAAGATINTPPSFTFTGADLTDTFLCSVDGAAPTSCVSPLQLTGLGQGPHTFAVQARDAATNIGPADSRSFTVDTVAPGTTIASGPSGVTTSTSAAFTYISEDSSPTFECSLDGGTFASCPASGAAYNNLADGGHTFAVRAADPAGNTGAAASQSWTVDATAPDTTITGGPEGLTAGASPTFTYLSTESGSTFECALDTAAFEGCPGGGRAYPSLAQGPHTFSVRAIDAAGGADPSPATRAFTVDSVGPDTLITQAPPASTTATTATVAFSATEPGSTFECSLDGGTFAACTSPHAVSGLSRAPHNLAVRARDAAGNPDASPALAAWTVTQLRPPTVTNLKGPRRVSRRGTATIARLSCPEGTCRLLTPKATVTIAGKKYQAKAKVSEALVNAGRTATISVVLPRKARAALGRAKTGRLRMSGRAVSTNGTAAAWAASVRLVTAKR